MRNFLAILTILAVVGCTSASSDKVDMGATEYTSKITTIDLEKCEVLTTYEEGDGAELLCRGLNNLPIYVTEGDLRFDVDIGVKNDQWASLSSFNTIGEEFDWQLKSGDPVAAIVRFIPDGMPEDIADLDDVFGLVIVGREGQPGCTQLFDSSAEAVQALIGIEQC